MSIARQSNSIHLGTLLNAHPEIVSNEQLLAEVDRHYHEDCDCGMKSKNTIEMLAQELHDAQDDPRAVALLKAKGDDKWDLETCYQWMGLLFGRNTINGKDMEKQAILDLSTDVWKYKFYESDKELDTKFGIDLVAKSLEGKIVAGIQVKPDSFYRKGLTHVAEANEEWEHPVYHLKYDKNRKWLNRLQIVSHFV